MANTRIKDLNNTATTVPSDAYVAIDGSANGTAKISRDNLRQDTADAIAAAPSTYNLAPLTSGSVDVDKGGTGSTTVAGAKTTLQIPNVGTAANEVPTNGQLGNMSFQNSEAVTVDDLTVDGQLTAAVGKPMPVNGPSMRLDGSNDYVEFADNDSFSFTNGTDDTPFSISAWVKMADAQYFGILSKNGSTNSLKEWFLWTDASNVLQLWLRDTSGNYVIIPLTGNLNDYVNEWTHISVSYGGAGPNSSVGFASADSAVNFYINGKIATKGTVTYSGTYLGMSNTAQPLTIGSVGGVFAEGEIRDVKLFNKELSLAEVREVYSNGQLPESFAESTGSADGGIYTSDFSAGVDGFAGTSLGTIDGNIDSIGGQNDNLRFTCSTDNGSHYTTRSMLVSNKQNRIEFDYYIPSSNSNLNGYLLYNGTTDFVEAYDTPTLDAWTRHSSEVTVGGSLVLYFHMRSNGSNSFTDSGGDDVFYIRNVRVTQIGSVLDARAEQFDTSTGKLYDLSGNDFVGTQSGGVSLLGREFPVYETGTWTPSITFGGGSTGITYSLQEGTYTRIGDTVHLAGIAQVSGLGSVTGTARVSGLPYTTAAFSPTGSYQTVPVLAFGATGLTSALIGLFEDSQPDMILYQTGSSGGSAASHANFTTSTSIRFSGTYQIQ